MYKFSKRSETQLATCHPDLVKIARLALQLTQVDFIVTEGHRPTERQKELFDQGLSRIDGINKKGKHNEDPSEALDFCAWVPGFKDKSFDPLHLCHIATAFICAAKILYERGQVSHLIRWGANWDGDGVLKYDQNFQDLPHVEIYKPS